MLYLIPAPSVSPSCCTSLFSGGSFEKSDLYPPRTKNMSMTPTSAPTLTDSVLSLGRRPSTATVTLMRSSLTTSMATPTRKSSGIGQGSVFSLATSVLFDPEFVGSVSTRFNRSRPSIVRSPPKFDIDIPILSPLKSVTKRSPRSNVRLLADSL